MSLATNSIFKKELLKDTSIPRTYRRLATLSMGLPFTYPGTAKKFILEAEDDEVQLLLVSKAFFGLDSSIDFLERKQKKKFYKNVLKNNWGVKNKKNLLQQISYVIDGTNSQYAVNQLSLYLELDGKEPNLTNIQATNLYKKIYTHYTDEEVKKLLGALDLIHKNQHLITTNKVLGFDLARIIYIIKMGYCNKYLSTDEAWLMIELLYSQFEKFDNYYDFFASNELGHLLFDYDRGLDLNLMFNARKSMMEIILIEETSPFNFFKLNSHIEEDYPSIFFKIYNKSIYN